jgi:transcriptional pleiotropic regulator of transition state genes
MLDKKVLYLNKGMHIMKSTGIVRKIDELGRIVLPIELRRTYDLAVKDAVEIYTDDDKIVLKKFQRACIFCGEAENVVEFKGRTVCEKCAAELGKK